MCKPELCLKLLPLASNISVRKQIPTLPEQRAAQREGVRLGLLRAVQ